MPGGPQGPELLVLDEITSTNDVARELAGRGCPEGSLVVAARQSAGRGRLGRSWQSQEGGLWFSLVLRPSSRLAPVVRLALVSAVGSAEGLHEKTGLAVGLKWPNDLHIAGRKVGGILHEAGQDWVVVGVGINVNQVAWDNELATPPTSLRLETGQVHALEPLLAAVVGRILLRYRQACSGEWSRVREAWRGLSVTLGKDVEVTLPDRSWAGLASDIDEDGNLLVKVGDGLVVVTAGDVTLRSGRR
jgi:BirA family biotin operon repressor/biotin-[acetyl-CoA-carboxylase] ligase